MKKSDGRECRPGEQSDAEKPALIRQQYLLDAPLDKVWRALSVPALRAHWLPDLDLATPEPAHAVPGEEIRYAMRASQPPYLASQVTLRITPTPGGGTLLTIVHVATASAHAANDGSAFMMRAA